MHPYPPSPASSMLSDDDAILPVYDAGSRACCTVSSSSPLPSAMPSPSSSLSLSSSSSLDNTARLWHHMLVLQRRYHCYNSARVSAALEDPSVAATVPSRACLDLLNDSIDLQVLPDAVRSDVAALFQQGGLEDDAGCLAESRLSWLLSDEDADEEEEEEDDDDDVVPLDIGLPLLAWVPTAAPALILAGPILAGPIDDAKDSIALAELAQVEQVEEEPEREEQSKPKESTERTERTDRTERPEAAERTCSAAPLRKLGLRFGLRLGLRLPTWRRQPWRLRLRV